MWRKTLRGDARRWPTRIARSVGYALSQQKRKLIEQGFGWVKTVGRMREVIMGGLEKGDQMFVSNMAAYNLVRMRLLGQVRPQWRQSRQSRRWGPKLGSNHRESRRIHR